MHARLPRSNAQHELQYRGVFWSQLNGKDWTITAFLQTNNGGLQLKIPKDQATATSIRRAIEKLMDVEGPTHTYAERHQIRMAQGKIHRVIAAEATAGHRELREWVSRTQPWK